MAQGTKQPIQVTFLRDIDNGGDKKQPGAIAHQFVEFVNGAKSSIHIAIYDFRLTPALGDAIITALKQKAEAGVRVRIAFDQGKPAQGTAEAFATMGSDPAPKGTKDYLEKAFQGSKVELKPIDPGSHLMHNKYIVRDVNTPDAMVWMGSANFTDDAWTYQDNNIVLVASPPLAVYYDTDFQELWNQGTIASTGVNDRGTVTVGLTKLDVAFSPGEGGTIDNIISKTISSAQHRIKIASMVITSHTILGALDDALRHNQVKEFGGVYDATQMDKTVEQWSKSAQNAGIIQTFKEVAGHLAGKHSVPYQPGGKHNFMHNKVVVCDDTVVTGSFNFSRNATMNAENILVIHDAALSNQYSLYIDQLITQYGHAPSHGTSKGKNPKS
jgi:phosphatidylserine/phosphatidylglycerophosphate/cardiolipin synthase-like enzyme